PAGRDARGVAVVRRRAGGLRDPQRARLLSAPALGRQPAAGRAVRGGLRRRAGAGVMTVGVGASSGATVEEVLAALDAVLPPGADDVRLATVAAREPVVARAAALRGWP